MLRLSKHQMPSHHRPPTPPAPTRKPSINLKHKMRQTKRTAIPFKPLPSSPSPPSPPWHSFDAICGSRIPPLFTMSITVQLYPVMPSRPCSFCLSLQGGSVFADFDKDD